MSDLSYSDILALLEQARSQQNHQEVARYQALLANFKIPSAPPTASTTFTINGRDRSLKNSDEKSEAKESVDPTNEIDNVQICKPNSSSTTKLSERQHSVAEMSTETKTKRHPTGDEPAQPPPPNVTYWSNTIRQRRTELGWTQKYLASTAGVGRRFVVEVESGKANVQLDKVLAVLAALRLDVEFKITDAPLPISEHSQAYLSAKSSLRD